jgi:formate hydrogenlyase subunit 3/multisubunit Na+/H+ antiporter MnhD subunit
MPFILLAGWLLSGVEASPGDLALAAQSASMLGLGFAFLLAIFPLYSWIPLLLEETSPFVVGFLLWILPTITLIFGAGFIDRYSWLRASPQLTTALQFTGTIMLVTGGLWAAFQRHIGRIMAYGSIAETGFCLLALSLDPKLGIPILFLLIPARALGLAVWSLSLTIIKQQEGSMRFGAVRGLLRSSPFASAGLVLATLSTGGFPLLAGFPARLALWDSLARVSIGAAIWMGVGIIGLLTASFRSLAVLSMAEEYTGWEVKEDWLQGIMLGLGMIGLFVLGLFPQTVQYFLSNLPAMFEHLGR